MRVLAVYPSFDPAVNEMAMVWRRICETTDTRCTVVANMKSVLKAHTSTQRTETIGNLEVHRFPSIRTSNDVMTIATSTPFDVIFCAISANMDIALKAQSLNGAPIVLHVEYFLDDEVFLNRRDYFGLPFLRPYLSERKRHRLHSNTIRILCSNPVEFTDPRAQRFEHLSYLPWPAPGDATPRLRAGRQMNSAAYIGSLSRGKGAATLFKFFEGLLAQEDDFHFEIVGPAIDRATKEGLVELLERFPGRVHAQLQVSRSEALKILSRSLFILSPGHRFGWGLIADAWGTGTPVLALTEHYDLKDGVNCFVVRTQGEFVAAATRLRDNPAVWDAIAAGGLASIREHSVDKVAARLHEEVAKIGKARAR